MYRLSTELNILIVMVFILSIGCTQASPGADYKLSADSFTLMSDDHSLSVSLQCPMFEFEKETVGGTAPLSIHGDIKDTGGMSISYPQIRLSNGGRLEVQLILQWSAKLKVLHKWARYRIAGGNQRLLLHRIVLESIDAHGQSVWTHGGRVSPANRYVATNTLQSLPFFIDGFFTGIEFPIAPSRVENGKIVLSHVPGFRLTPDAWYESREAVYGIATPGDEQRAFEHYIIWQGRTIKKLHVNYNSWWTTPVPYTEADVLKVADSFATNLHDKYKVNLDSFCIDMGWSNPQSIWEIDPKLFPNGFTKIRTGIKKTGASLGLWLSPSSGYPPALDNQWAKKQGYEMFEASPGSIYACVAGPKYSSQFRSQLSSLIKEYGMTQIKTDGLVMWCNNPDHGHEVGGDSYETVTQGHISNFEAIHKANPKAIIEPFGLGYDPSPWWLFYTDEMLACHGDDAPPARVPCPVGRESSTTVRDYFNLQGAALNPSPINAQEVVGIIHQTDEDFMNDGVTVLMRGNLFFPMYINPRYMNPQRWANLAGLIKWARANDQTLKETVPLLPASWQNGGVPRFTDAGVMPREPYGYAHFSGARGLIHLRNPWIASQTYRITLDQRIGVPKNAADLSAVSLYPDVRVFGSGLKYGDTLDVHMAPYETLVLSLSSTQPVEGVPSVDSVKPSLKASVTQSQLDRVDFGGEPALTPDATSPVGDSPSYVRLKMSADIEVDSPSAKLLVLCEGDQDLMQPYGGLVHIGYKEMQMTPNPSAGIWSSTGLKPREFWSFLELPLKPGKYPVSLEVLAGIDCKRISVWVLGSKPGGKSSYPNALPQPESISLGSICLLPSTDTSTVPPETTRLTRVMQRIDGVYLDSLEPVSVVQGWGTLQKNRSVWEKPMRIGSQPFRRGLGTHAASRIVYALDGKYSRFQAMAGADAAHSPSITFEVWADGKELWKSGLMTRDDPAEKVDLDVKGVQRLELVVGDGGNGISGDHADWADAKLLR